MTYDNARDLNAFLHSDMPIVNTQKIELWFSRICRNETYETYEMKLYTATSRACCITAMWTVAEHDFAIFMWSVT